MAPSAKSRVSRGEATRRPRPVLSPRLRALFDAEVVAAQLRGRGDPDQLLAEECAALERAWPERREQFAAGRMCARRALTELGYEGLPLRVGTDRLPQWPEGTVGSISHTRGYCAAVVASARRVRSLGLDIEEVAAVTPALWSKITTREERSRLDAAGAAPRLAAAVIFAAKEAFYKCQFALAGERVSFADVSVDIEGGPSSSGSWSLRPQRALKVERLMQAPLQGRYLFVGGYVTAGIAFPASRDAI